MGLTFWEARQQCQECLDYRKRQGVQKRNPFFQVPTYNFYECLNVMFTCSYFIYISCCLWFLYLSKSPCRINVGHFDYLNHGCLLVSSPDIGMIWKLVLHIWCHHWHIWFCHRGTQLTSAVISSNGNWNPAMVPCQKSQWNLTWCFWIITTFKLCPFFFSLLNHYVPQIHTVDKL